MISCVFFVSFKCELYTILRSGKWYRQSDYYADKILAKDDLTNQQGEMVFYDVSILSRFEADWESLQ